MGKRFGRAEVQYGDWRGDVALDNPDDDRELYRIAGVDQKKWQICGLEIYGSSGMGITAYVLAVRRDLIKESDDWDRVSREYEGAIPVTEFELREGTALALLGLFKRSDIRATLRSVIWEGDVELEIVDTVHPPEENSAAN